MYRYLLNPEEIQYYAKHEVLGPFQFGTAHTYKFHTNILAVNKTIFRQATKYLHDHAAFIQVSYNETDFFLILRSTNVPYVTDDMDKIDKSMLPHFTIDVDTKRSTCRHPTLGLIPTQSGKVLMLSRDFHHLRGFFRVGIGIVVAQPSGVYIIAGHRPIPVAAESEPPSLSLKLPSLSLKAPARLESSMAFSTLQFFNSTSSLVGAGYDISFEGFESINETSMRCLKKSLAPSIIWLGAQEWDRLEFFLELKDNADKLSKKTSATTGQLNAALRSYAYIWNANVSNFLVSFPHIDISADTALLSLKQRWRFLKWDAIVSHAWLRFRRDWGQHPHDLIKACSSFEDVIQKLPLHLGQLQPHEVHHHGLKQALSLYAIPRLGQELSKPRPDPILLVIVHALRAKESTGIDPLDFTAMLRFRADEHANGYLDYVSWLQCRNWVPRLSAKLEYYKRTALTFDHWVDQTCARPDGLVKWQDVEHLSRLTEAEKDDITISKQVLGLSS